MDRGTVFLLGAKINHESKILCSKRVVCDQRRNFNLFLGVVRGFPLQKFSATLFLVTVVDLMVLGPENCRAQIFCTLSFVPACDALECVALNVFLLAPDPYLSSNTLPE